MAAQELYDYLATATPDTTASLNLAARGVAKERVERKQVVHPGDDGSEEVCSLSTVKVCYLEIPWGALNESDAGLVIDHFCNATLGNGKDRTFPYVHAYGTTTHTYVVRFDSDFTRDIREGNIHASSIRLKIRGRIPD
jgi:hypothetical protein